MLLHYFFFFFTLKSYRGGMLRIHHCKIERARNAIQLKIIQWLIPIKTNHCVKIKNWIIWRKSPWDIFSRIFTFNGWTKSHTESASIRFLLSQKHIYKKMNLISFWRSQYVYITLRQNAPIHVYTPFIAINPVATVQLEWKQFRFLITIIYRSNMWFEIS